MASVRLLTLLLTYALIDSTTANMDTDAGIAGAQEKSFYHATFETGSFSTFHMPDTVPANESDRGSLWLCGKAKANPQRFAFLLLIPGEALTILRTFQSSGVDMKLPLSAVGLSVVGLFFVGCISTTVVYNPNVHQTGRTAGRGIMKVKAAVGAASAIKTGDVADDSTRRDEITTELPAADLQPAFELGLWYGLSDYVDLGLDGCGSLNSLGGRAYAKFQVTDRAKPTAIALMPAVVLLAGSRDEEEPKDADAATEKISSSAVVFELHLPVSVRTGRRTELIATPRLLSLHYAANYKSTGPNPALHNLALEDQRDLFGAGLSLGFRWGVLHPEASFTVADKSAPLYSFGIGVQR